MSKIWIVQGSAGSYDDYREWPVAAYIDEEQAKEHVRLAVQRTDIITGMSSESERARYGKQLNPYDDDANIYDASDIDYSYYEVNTYDSPDEYNRIQHERIKKYWVCPYRGRIEINLSLVKDIEITIHETPRKKFQKCLSILCHSTSYIQRIYDENFTQYENRKECEASQLPQELQSLLDAWENYKRGKLSNEEIRHKIIKMRQERK